MGTLYLVGTPIGNLEDITYRAVRILNEVDLIACEDTRVTSKLTSHYHIETPLKSYHEHNKDKMTSTIIGLLLEGKNIALVSDAGLPMISDPGYELVIAARGEAIEVVTVPGPHAALTALMTSGLSSYQFFFDGFLPRKDKEKRDRLKFIMAMPASSIIYESPYRVKDTLEKIKEVDQERRVTIARELTKRFEQVVTLPVQELIDMIETKIPLKGEFVLVIDGQYEVTVETQWWDELTEQEHIEKYLESVSLKDAIKQVATDRRLKKRDVYNRYHE